MHPSPTDAQTKTTVTCHMIYWGAPNKIMSIFLKLWLMMTCRFIIVTFRVNNSPFSGSIPIRYG